MKYPGRNPVDQARSQEAYGAIEKGMIDIERALMPDGPAPDQVSPLVGGLMDKYNAVLAEMT